DAVPSRAGAVPVAERGRPAGGEAAPELAAERPAAPPPAPAARRRRAHPGRAVHDPAGPGPRHPGRAPRLRWSCVARAAPCERGGSLAFLRHVEVRRLDSERKDESHRVASTPGRRRPRSREGGEMPVSFNLVDEPWLPVVWPDGTAGEAGLRDALV